MQDQETPPPGSDTQTETLQQSNPGQALAITGLVFAFLPLQIVGLILSIIAKKKARKGSSTSTIALIGIILNAVLGIITSIVVVVLLLVAWSGIQNAAVASAFLTAVQDKDYSKALSYTDDPADAKTKAFLESASTKIGTSNKQVDSAVDADKHLHGFVYELSGGEAKYAKVTVSNNDNKRYVYEFVFGDEKLNPAPREQAGFVSQLTESSADDAVGTESDSAESTEKLACITADDIARAPSKAEFIDVTGKHPAIFADMTVFFNPDALTYQYPEVTAVDLDNMAEYIKSLSGKSFVIEIMGSVSADRTNQASINFSAQRANKLKQELVSRGVNVSGITVLTANTENYVSNLTGADYQKRGDIILIKGC